MRLPPGSPLRSCVRRSTRRQSNPIRNQQRSQNWLKTPLPATALATNDAPQQPTPDPPQAPIAAGRALRRRPRRSLQDPAVAPEPAQTSPAPQPHTVTLPAGTTVSVRLAETLSTNDNYTGDTFRATLESPIIADGFIIADKGSKVLGQIVKAQKAGRVEGVSELTLALTEINTTDGQRVKIETSTWDKKGPKSTDQDAAKIAGGAAVGAIIGAIAGGGKGAAIGAGAGGAAGTGAVIATRGKDCNTSDRNAAYLPSCESRYDYREAESVVSSDRGPQALPISRVLTRAVPTRCGLVPRSARRPAGRSSLNFRAEGKTLRSSEPTVWL